MMAPDGACKTFDAAADGFVRSEGCAMIALKRLSDALTDGSPILAVIRGSAVNSDGRSSGLTVPNGLAQQALIRTALAHAGLEARDIDYVEAHGTGTPLGDPIEVEALGTVMCEGRTADKPLLIGSIKTNLGHTEAAAGVAGLLKAAMALRHEAIPPHLHFTTPNPGIRWADLPICVPCVLTPWPREATPRRAGVSSFGFSGTNAHVILEEAPALPAQKPIDDVGPCLFPVSARDETALGELVRRHAEWLAENPALSLADVTATAAAGRSHMQHRAAFVVGSTQELEHDLQQFAGGRTPRNAWSGSVRVGERPKIAFLFTGQGAQYAGMGRGLYDSEPVFRSALDRTAAILYPHLDRPLLDLMFPSDPDDSQLAQTGCTQPAMFALQYALLELWRSWGIAPSLVLGHSVGEYAAAYAAGMFGLEDGLALIAARGRLMQQLPAGGGMAAVFADEVRVATSLAEWEGGLNIAAVNGPEEIVVSGDADILVRYTADLARHGIQSRTLDVSHAFHSHRLDPMLDKLQELASKIAYPEPRIPFVSNLTGATWPSGTRPDGVYWRRHAREPVRFGESLATLREAGITTLVEIGPHPTLLALAGRATPDIAWTSLASLRRGRDDRQAMLSSLAQLYVRGADVRWDAVVGGRTTRRVALPTYPFQRERHWALDNAPMRAPAKPGHPLLGEKREFAATRGTFVWERDIGFDSHPWLRDHCVQGHAIVPASAYIEMALAAGSEIFGSGSLVLSQIENLRPIILRDGMRYLVQATLLAGEDGAAAFAVHGRAQPIGEAHSSRRLPWVSHMTARIEKAAAPQEQAPGTAIVAAARDRCHSEQQGFAFYAALAEKGNEWGPCFQGVDRLWHGDGEIVGRVHIPASIAREATQYRFHPAVSDACGHVLVAFSQGNGALVAQGADEIIFHRSPHTDPGSARSLWVYASSRPPPVGHDDVTIRDMSIYDDAGRLVSEIRGVPLKYLDRSADCRAVPTWYHAVAWRPQAIAGPRLRAAEGGPWLVFADASRLGDLIANRRAPGRTILVAQGDRWSFDNDRASIRPGEPSDYVKLIDAVGAVSAVVHLWNLDTAHGDDEAGLGRGPESLLHLLQALQSVGHSRPRIWLVTGDAQPVLASDACTAPLGAMLWGMGKTLSAEHPALWGGLIDLDADRSGETADCLIREIEAGTAEDKLAFRGGRRYVPRLVGLDVPAIDQFAARKNGTYLITGGLGGIGLAVAQWLVERGARNLVLLDRTPLPPRQTWKTLAPNSLAERRVRAVTDMEALGASVETVACDITVEGELEQCLQARQARSEPAICGVFHAAGLLQLQPLASQDAETLRRSVAAKIIGTLRLHRLLRDQPLDCFVLFSSMSALLNSPLLGSYAAGDAFLDAFAHYRHAQGLPALSINWGTWGEVGMVIDDDVAATGKLLKGVATIPTAKGLAALGHLLATSETQASVLPVDWQVFTRAYPEFATDPFLQAVAAVDTNDGTHFAGSSLEARPDATPEHRTEFVAGYLRTEAARVLGVAPARFDITLPLSSYGLNSLMAVQLKNRVEADLGAVLPMVRFLNGPSIEELASTVVEAVRATRHAPMESIDAVAWEDGTL